MSKDTLKESVEYTADEHKMAQAILGALEYRGFYDCGKYLDETIIDHIRPVISTLIEQTKKERVEGNILDYAGDYWIRCTAHEEVVKRAIEQTKKEEPRPPELASFRMATDKEISENPSYYSTIVSSQIWQEWIKYCEENPKWDIHESVECGWLSMGHWEAFINWVKNK